MSLSDVLAGGGVGLISGATAGLLGVSPGGGLVVFSVLMLGAEQHAAQGISLVAQIPPTSLAGIKRYWENGSRAPVRWLVLLTIGFVVGGVGGALAAGAVSSSVLRWTYVAYLTALDALVILRLRSKRSDDSAERRTKAPHWISLLAVGAIAGFSSGFMGIGGGLAITAGLGAALKLPQLQAQLISLMISIIPTTVPAAYVYWRQGWSPPWPALAAAIIGLLIGTNLGARLANGVSEIALRRILVGFVSAMAVYMAYKALT